VHAVVKSRKQRETHPSRAVAACPTWNVFREAYLCPERRSRHNPSPASYGHLSPAVIKLGSCAASPQPHFPTAGMVHERAKLRSALTARSVGKALSLDPWDGVDMPLYWTIDSKQRLFTGTAEGEVTLADAMSLLEALAGAKALSYRKLFDGRAVQSAMTGEELLAVCAEIRVCHELGPVGALAIVCTPEQTVTFARLLGALAAADRPIKLFSSLRQAGTWLDLQRR
jgi:hypothetical protein